MWLDRKSVRDFEGGIKRVISPKLIGEVLKEASKAPSAGGMRAYHVVTIIQEKIKAVAVAARQGWITNAAVVFVICADLGKSARRYGDRGRQLYCIQDATLYGLYLDLLFVEHGFGTCWVGSFDEQKIREIAGIIDPALKPITLLIVGYKKGGGK